MIIVGDALSLRQPMQAHILTQLKRERKKGENLHPVMGINPIPRDNPETKAKINPPTIRESGEEIPMKTWEEMCDKERNGTVMVRL
jgi:hypothetical protein